MMRTQGVAEQARDQRQDQQHYRAIVTVVLLSSYCDDSWRLQARSATRSPSRPEGRSVSTMISPMKAKMSW